MLLFPDIRLDNVRKKEYVVNGEFRRQMEENGAEVEEVLKRFLGNEALYMKFVVKFPEDENYKGTIRGIEEQDYEAAFKNAHSLKGVTANLGLEPIRAAASCITDLLREKQPQEVDVEQLNQYKEQLEKAYECFRNIIVENKEQGNIP